MGSYGKPLATTLKETLKQKEKEVEKYGMFLLLKISNMSKPLHNV